MTSSAGASGARGRAASVAGSKTKRPPGGVRSRLRSARHRNDDLLAGLDLAGGEFRRRAVGDAEADSDRRRFLPAQNINDAVPAAAGAALSLAAAARAAAVAATIGASGAAGRS